MKYLWNKPTIYVAANQFHHKHEEISSSVMHVMAVSALYPLQVAAH